jgi:hypothetical protein
MTHIVFTNHQAAAVAERIQAWGNRRGASDIFVGFLADGVCGPGLYCWAVNESPGAAVPLFAKELEHPRTFDAARLPARDADGSVMHPDMDGIGEEEYPFNAQLRAIGWNSIVIGLDDDPAVPRERKDAHFPGHSSDGTFDWWTPSAPGDGSGEWLLAAIYDTEEGPVALYVKAAA